MLWLGRTCHIPSTLSIHFLISLFSILSLLSLFSQFPFFPFSSLPSKFPIICLFSLCPPTILPNSSWKSLTPHKAQFSHLSFIFSKQHYLGKVHYINSTDDSLNSFVLIMFFSFLILHIFSLFQILYWVEEKSVSGKKFELPKKSNFFPQNFFLFIWKQRSYNNGKIN